MDIKVIMLASSVALLAFGVVLLITSILMKNQVAIGERVKMLTGDTVEAKKNRAVDEERKKKTSLPISKVFEDQLSMAGIHMRAEEFLIVWLIIIILPAVLLRLLNANILTVIVVMLVALVFPLVFVRGRRRKQLTLFDNQLGDALMLMGNCLESGLTFQQAMGSIAREMQDPISKEFSRVVKEIQLGTGLEDALMNMQNRIDSAELMLTISAVQIQHQVGGNLKEILSNISSTISDRQKLKDDIRVMTATGRMSGMVIGLLPIVLGGLLMLVNPQYIQAFFYTKIGTVMLIVAGVMEILGFLVIKKVITIKY